MSAFVIKAEALPAWRALCGALDQLEDQGRVTYCRIDPAPFTSEDKDERREARGVWRLSCCCCLSALR